MTLVLLVSLGGEGCMAKNEPATTREKAMATSTDSRTTVRGTAQNAKAGAVIVTASNEAVYLGGLDSWPNEVTGKPVTATGILTTVNHPKPVTGDGLPMAGMEGIQTILRDAQWTSP